MNIFLLFKNEMVKRQYNGSDSFFFSPVYQTPVFLPSLKGKASSTQCKIHTKQYNGN